MPRTKGDFLDYARTAIIPRPTSGDPSIETDSSSPFFGDEDSSDNAGGTGTSSYSPDANSIAATGGIWSSDDGDTGSEQGENFGISSGDRSGDATFDRPSFPDIEIRNYNTGPNLAAQSIQRGSIKSVKSITKKRSNPINKLGQAIGNRLPKTEKVKSATKPVRKLLTIVETTTYRKGLIELVIYSADNMDNAIQAITKGHRPVQIWSTLEYADAEILVDSFLDMGQKSEHWATAVRKVVNYQKKARAGLILTPRVYMSIVYLFTTGFDLRF